MLGRREEAEDMAQEVFVQVFKAIGQFRGECKLSTWLYRVAINLCKNRSKYLSRRPEDTQDALDTMLEHVPLGGTTRGATSADVSRPDQMVEGLQMEALVRHCIAQLEPEFREALVLRDIENLSYDEIEAVTGVAEGTVKSRIHRARALLKELLEQTLGEKIA